MAFDVEYIPIILLEFQEKSLFNGSTVMNVISYVYDKDCCLG